MTKFAEAPYQPSHTGKTGYVSAQPRGSPKPFPFGIAEEFGANLYPQYRPFIPTEFQDYADSYIDLRNKPYKIWYDKWGKPHINKWWQEQLDNAQILREALLQAQKKSNEKRGDTRSIDDRWYYQHRCNGANRFRKSEYTRWWICEFQHRSSRQRQDSKRRTPYRRVLYRRRHSYNNPRWNR